MAFNGRLLAGDAINGLGKMVGKKATSYLGLDVAESLVRNKGTGFIGGLNKWIMNDTTTMQKVARGAALYGGAMAAGRIASGGGLYRDRSGQFNVIGVPFI